MYIVDKMKRAWRKELRKSLDKTPEDHRISGQLEMLEQMERKGFLGPDDEETREALIISSCHTMVYALYKKAIK